MAENAVRSARRAYRCYPAPKFDPLESRDLKRLARRWASNRRAEQQPGIVVRIGGLADKRMMFGYSPWLKYDIWQPAKRRARPRLMFRGLQEIVLRASVFIRANAGPDLREADSRQGVADIPRGAPCGEKPAREARFPEARIDEAAVSCHLRNTRRRLVYWMATVGCAQATVSGGDWMKKSEVARRYGRRDAVNGGRRS